MDQSRILPTLREIKRSLLAEDVAVVSARTSSNTRTLNEASYPNVMREINALWNNSFYKQLRGVAKNLQAAIRSDPSFAGNDVEVRVFLSDVEKIDDGHGLPAFTVQVRVYADDSGAMPQTVKLLSSHLGGKPEKWDKGTWKGRSWEEIRWEISPYPE